MLHSRLVALAALPLLLASCAEAEDALNDAAASTACSLAKRAADPVLDEARQAAEQLGAEPEAAQRELENLKDVVDAAADQLSGETKQALEDIGSSLGTLAGEAKEAAQGSLDQEAVDAAQRELDTAVDELTTIC